MNSKSDTERVVTYFGELKDKKLEKEYFTEEINWAVRYIKPIILSLGILYLLFIIPDYFLLKNVNKFNYILLNRLSFLILVVLFYIRISKLKNSSAIVCWITVYEIIVSLLFLSVCYLYENPNFLIQAFGVMIIILGVFLVPNRWINMIIVALFISIGFFYLTLIHFNNIRINELSAAIVYLLIVITLCSISSYRINYLKRMQYLNNKELERLATMDPLTGIYNRFKFDEELDKYILNANEQTSNLSLVIFDIDNFKDINDNYGHLVGDHVIMAIVELVKSKIGETAIFSRWGGEEFVILFPHTKRDKVFKLIEKIRLDIENYKFEKAGKVTCSFGIVILRKDEDAMSLLHRADILLYEAKKNGKNGIRC